MQSGKIALGAKDDLKGRLGRSSDRADAVAMAFYSRVVRRTPDVEPLKMG